MFSSILRTQAWLPVRSCRTRICLARSARNAPRTPNLPSSSIIRPLATSRPLRNNQGVAVGQSEWVKPTDSKNAVYVANFPFWAEEQELREKFEVFGPIARVNIEKTDSGQSRGYGNILFTNPADAETAIRSVNKDGLYIGERRIRARYPSSPSNTLKGERKPANQLFIGNLPFVLEEHELREKLETFGEISHLRIGYTSDGRARGFAHVDFVKLEDAITAYESAKLEPIHIFGRDLRIDYPQLKAKPPQVYQVFVGNLPYMYETALLREAFETFGEVAKVRSGYDANGRALPYAHLEFLTLEAAEAAYEASLKKQIYVFGRYLRVEIAKYPGGMPEGKGEITALFYRDFRRGGEKGIREAFKDFESRIIGVNCLKRRPDAKLTGQGFINFLTPEAAQEAFDALNGKLDFHVEFSHSKVPDLAGRRTFKHQHGDDMPVDQG